MTTTGSLFEQLRAAMDERGVAAALALLAGELRERRKYHELFEALKMQARHEAGLPLLYGETPDAMDDAQRTRLEDGLLAACREVGGLLMRGGAIQEGWMYLRPLGEPRLAAELLRDVEVDEDNLDEMIRVTLHEGVDPRRGFGLVLRHYGTCNAITTFEQVMPQRSRAEQQDAAAQLLEHLHGELRESLRSDIARQSGSSPTEPTIERMVADRDWLFGEHVYHVDTTHLASVVRYARLLADPAHLRLALDLTAYGRRLHTQFQFAGEPPFEDLYASHALFFAAQLGEQVEEAVAWFRRQAQETDPQVHGLAAIDTCVDLLARLGRPAEAAEALVELLPGAETGGGLDVTRSSGWAPSLLELCRRSGRFEPLLGYCLERDDLLGYAAGLTTQRAAGGPET
ncbi:MAG: hypothetical protein J5I93_21510 [Pirellulaceae bacterium]|nr:hypothetical protein [Pirellulaceae bacterium]